MCFTIIARYADITYTAVKRPYCMAENTVHEGRNGREKVNKKQEPRKEKGPSVTKESDKMDNFTCPCSRWIVDWFTLFVA